MLTFWRGGHRWRRRGCATTGSASAVLWLLEERFASAQARGDADHLGQLSPGWRVGGEEPRRAGEDQGAFLGPGWPGVELTYCGLVGLEPVELGVLGEEGVAERSDGLGGIAASGQIAVDDGAGFIDSSFLVPAVLEVG